MLTLGWWSTDETANKIQALAWAHGVVHKHDEKTLAAFYRAKAREIARQKGLKI